MNTVSQNTSNASADRPKPTCHNFKKPGRYRNHCRLLKRQKEQIEDTQYNPANKNSSASNSIPNNNTNKNNNNNNSENSDRAEKSQKMFTHPARHVGRQTIARTNATMKPMQPIDRLPGTENRKDRIRSKKKPIKMTRMKLLRLQPKI